MIIALNIETTWLNYKQDKIIKIDLIKFDKNNFNIVDRFITLINPWIDIPELIVNITNINNSDLLDAPYFDEISNKISDFIWNLPILWHNIFFDKDFLIFNGVFINDNIFLDTYLLANILDFDKHSLSLDYLSSEYNLDLKLKNNTINNVEIIVKLFSFQLKQIDKLSIIKKKNLKYIFSKSLDKGFNYILENYLDNVDNIDKTIFLKNILSILSKKEKRIKKIKNNNIEENITFKDILKNIADLELRDNQLVMSDIVNDCLSNNKKWIIEAPTWVWKTFAYLIPSIIYSVKNNSQVFISTSTKALQDQIFYKDLEFLWNNLDIDFSYSKLKWKSNYFWVYSFIRFFENEESFDIYKTSFIWKIIMWLYNSSSFELDEINFNSKEYFFKNEINADNLLTFSNKNIFSDREPIIIQRKKVKKSNIVIINNNLLFQDIDSGSSILGKIKNLILDEAHNLEDVVTNSLKKSISLIELERIWNQIRKILEKNKINNLNFDQKFSNLILNIDNLFSVYKDYLFYKVDNRWKYRNYLLEEEFYNKFLWDIDTERMILSIMSNILEIKDFLSFVSDDIYLEMNKQLNYLDVFYDCLYLLKDKDKVLNSIVILNYSESKGFFIEFTLLNIWNYLNSGLWNMLDSCILTSATLKTNDNFDYINNVLELKWFDFYTIKTDFNYSKQALLYIPNDLWSIKGNLDNIVKFLYEFLIVVKGNTLVLFTSFSIIIDIYNSIYRNLKDNNINLYAQSIGWWKHKLIDLFRINSNNSILFWTDTFWEWIDISGDSLKYLIIHKIPFMVPSDPIFQARSALFDNSFKEYSIPKAILKLKQWFGRLIRTKTDSWIIIFLDDRIYSTAWWNILLSAFPKDIIYKKWSSDKLFNVLK